VKCRATEKDRGNAGLWTARKTKSRFSIAAHEPLEIAAAISTFPQSRLCDRMEKWKSKDWIPTFPHSVYLSQIKKRKETQSRLLTSSFRLISELENANVSTP
jgi:hypothetical protein